MQHDNIIDFLEKNTLKACEILKSGLSYKEASQKSINCIKKYYTIKFEYTDEVDSWIRAGMSKWEYECPPSDVYPRLLVLANYALLLPEDIFLCLMKAMVYFGCYENVIDLSKKRLEAYSDCDEFTIIKYMCKAYKSLGKYREALNAYKKVIKSNAQSQDEQKEIFTLILLGKLYNDYHQKKGLYETHIKTAFEKIKTNSNDVDYKSQVPRLAADSYAKIAVSNNKDDGKEIYNDVLLSFENSSSDRDKEKRLRVKLNYDNALINKMINDFKKGDFDNILSKIDEMIGDIKTIDDTYYNERAYAIRITQSSKLIRKFYEKLRKYGNGADELLSEYSCDYVLAKLSTSIGFCKKYRENKFLAVSWLEEVKWSVLKKEVEDKTLNRADYESWIKLLNDAAKVLETEEKDVYLVSDTYFNVQFELAKLHSKHKDFSSALTAYRSLYSHFKVALKEIKGVVDKINGIIEGNQENDGEFAMFGNKELESVRASIFSDYHDISTRLLEVIDFINTIQNKEISSFIDYTIDMIKRTDYHELLNSVNKTVSSLDNSDFDKRQTKKELKALTERINQMGYNLEKIFEMENFDPQAELELCVSNPIFRDSKEHISIAPTPDDVKIEINYNKRYFFSIVQGLINNVEKLAQNQNLSEWKITFRFSRVKDLHGYHEVVYLHAEDNVGGYESLNNIVNFINADSYDSIERDGGGGTGLVTIKKIASKGINWEVKESDSDKKELSIPIYVGK